MKKYIDEIKTEQLLNETDFIKKTFFFREVDSTNKKARGYAKQGAPEGTIVIALSQKTGKGRLNRIWESPPGGLYFSIILKPDEKEYLSILPIMASVVISNAAEKIGVKSNVKWPNDVRVDSKKISGILLETEFIEDKVGFVVLGIGINLNSEINDYSKKIQGNITTIKNILKKEVDPYDFIKELIICFEKYYSYFRSSCYEKILSDWEKKTNTLGKKVKIKDKNQDIIGTAIAIDKYGFLIVEDNNGVKKRITSGDCFYIL